MLDIDFLPDSYRHQKVQRKNQAWRGLVAALFAAGLGSAAVYQQRLYRQARTELIESDAPYALAQAQTAHLGQLRDKLHTAQVRADLYIYLRHPWPRTQLLATIAEALPEQITLEELKVVREATPQRPARTAPPVVGQPTPEVAKPDPAENDLAKLRDECDSNQTVVLLTGGVRETGKLYEFLHDLTESNLFTSAEVLSIESVSGDDKAPPRFTARLVVRPGYGQPGGPAVMIPSAAGATANLETPVEATTNLAAKSTGPKRGT